MKHQKILIASILMILAAFVSALAGLKYVKGRLPGVSETAPSGNGTPDEISLFPAEIQTILLQTAPTPSPSPRPELSKQSVDILSGGRDILSVADENTAKVLLNRYLHSFRAVTEEEVFISSRFGTEVTIRRSEGNAPYLLFDDAYELLTRETDLIPVITETMLISWSDVPYTLSSMSTNEHMYRKERKILQFGTEGRNIYSMIRTYAGDLELSTSQPELAHVFPKRDMMIENGNASLSQKKEKAVDSAFSVLFPIDGKVLRAFGEEDSSFHGGIDLSAENGMDVLCPADGVIVYLADRGAYGFTVDIDHGNGFLSRLTHLSGTDLLMSQRIFAGERVSSLREKDFSQEETPHLHYELFYQGVRVDPSPYFKKG